jgi:NAD(P)-dependent dehydrogenase (short-subunit alcohol dehydrogenase family)
MRIKDSVFLIGGGSSGLGQASAERLHAAGASVMIADLNHEQGEALVKQLGERARCMRTDVSQEADAQAVVDATVSEFGRIDGLINCAGVAPGERVVGKQGPHKLETFARCVQINLVGTFNMTRIAAAAMAEQSPNAVGERGVIINTASIAAYEGQIGQSAYAASKAGVIGMTLPIARELARVGIRVVTIAPGLFLTPMMQGLSVEAQEALGKSTPFPQRLGQPAEYAALAQHIFENEMLNGTTIRLDGAVRLTAK